MKHGRAEVVAICYCGMVTAEARESTCFKVEFLTASLWIWCFEVSSFDSQMHFATPSKKWAVLCLDWKQDDAILHGCLSEWMSKLPELALCWLDDHSRARRYWRVRDVGGCWVLVGSCCFWKWIPLRDYSFWDCWCMLMRRSVNFLFSNPSTMASAWTGLLNIAFLCFSSPCCFGKRVI